ncbi:hypothetical protein [Cystobacter ferrugineus]|uniref:Uncharacterized protein n=1 Tax=Cystobacter ferrugineus TaxID=83449 RepID=A0A1L9BF80_9BACT|nr:hypothetical protein [Cystobacter ferrugineus]OJH40865.1 hypothetical protein BON30_08030 [Cystobacter ferrugineus]
MSRIWGVILALWFTALPVASAQEGMIGLPLVAQKNGWARYAAESSEGPTEVVFKVGAAGVHKGRKGQWLILEVDAPGMGRISVHFLVAGGKFAPDNLLLVRSYVPGQEPQEGEPSKEPVNAVPSLKLVRKHTETVAGREIEVTEYSAGNALTAGWSPSVPGLGLTYIRGDNPLRLVAFGVGGDPWKGSGSGLPQWPQPEKGKDKK